MSQTTNVNVEDQTYLAVKPQLPTIVIFTFGVHETWIEELDNGWPDAISDDYKNH
jgi:hypothetical protein